jgi:hypothetical protein
MRGSPPTHRLPTALTDALAARDQSQRDGVRARQLRAASQEIIHRSQESAARALVARDQWRLGYARANRLCVESLANVQRSRELVARSEMECLETALDRRQRPPRYMSERDPAPATDHLGRLTLEQRLLRACVMVFGVSSAGLTAVAGGEHCGVLAASDPGFAEVDDLQFRFGEGPAIDAVSSGRRIIEPDLEAAQARWPAFAPAAMARGIHAGFALPFTAGTCLGAISMYRSTPGDLAPVVAGVEPLRVTVLAMHLVLDLIDVAPGALPDLLGDTTDRRSLVHQAVGMIAAQLEVNVADALGCLRARAWALDRSIERVAADVVDRRVRFDHDT